MKIAAPRGDTLVEVMFAVGIFGMVAIGAIGIMNRGLYDAQKALEITMARQEIDAQAEALRFVHEACSSEKNTTTKLYTQVWNAIKSTAYTPQELPANFHSTYNGHSCDNIYNGDAFPDKAFVVNTRRLEPEIIASWIDLGHSILNVTGDSILVRNYRGADHSQVILDQTPVYPRLLFTNRPIVSEQDDTGYSISDNDINKTSTYHDTLTKAQGIWITAVAADNSANPEYYDFYIRTCWFAPGSDDSVTISTVTRLSNPEL